MKVNQDSVETYLEDIIKEGIDWVSEEEAKEYVMTLADKIDSVSKYTAEKLVHSDDLKTFLRICHYIYIYFLIEYIT